MKLALILFFYLGAARAQDFSLVLPSSATFDVSRDSNQSINNGLQLDVGTAKGYRVLGGVSSSRSRDSADTYHPRGLMLGVGTDPIDIWSFTLQYNYWGIPQEIFSNSVGLTTVYMGLGSQLSLTPRFKKIHGEINGPVRTTEFNVNSFGLLFDYVLDLSQVWSWSLFGEGNQYSPEIALLQTNIDRIMILAPNVGEMTNSFVKNSVGTAIDYRIKKLTLGLDLKTSTSVISNTRFRTVSISAHKKLTQSFGLGGTLGNTRQVEAQVDPTRFLSISISYFWP